MIISQEVQWWTAVRPPEFIFMDSFSELTDQYFTFDYASTDDRGFYANYSDVARQRLQSGDVTSHGLLATKDLEHVYFQLFNAFHALWPDTPIIFVHFPMDLEMRGEFLQRGRVIHSAVNRIAKFDPLVTSVVLTNWIARRPENIPEGLEKFPYHFDQKTYEILTKEVDKKLKELGGLHQSEQHEE